MKRLTRGKALVGSGTFGAFAQGSFTHAAGTATLGAQVSYTQDVTGVLRGDLVVASSNAVPGSAVVAASVPGAGTVQVTVHAPNSGTVIWSAGTVFYRVERLA